MALQSGGPKGGGKSGSAGSDRNTIDSGDDGAEEDDGGAAMESFGGADEAKAHGDDGAQTAASSATAAPGKCLVLTEVPARSARTLCAAKDDAVAAANVCDVACLVFDPHSKESLRFIQQLQPTLPHTIPIVFVATKQDSDAGESSDEVMAEARAFCESLQLSPPILTSALTGLGLAVSTGDHRRARKAWSRSKSASASDGDPRSAEPAFLFDHLLTVAQHPHTARPVNEEMREKLRARRRLQKGLALGAVGFGLLVWAAVAWRASEHRNAVAKRQHR